MYISVHAPHMTLWSAMYIYISGRGIFVVFYSRKQTFSKSPIPSFPMYQSIRVYVY